MARLEVEIDGNINKLEKSLNQAEKDLKGFDKSVKQSSNNINNSGKKASGGINKLGKSTANAVPTLNEFSRVIQDAPFGIQGVANNITQLTQNFGYLKNQTGSTKEAFKLLLSSLTGPAGILLAVSAVTSVLVSYGDELFKTSEDTNKLTEATKGLIGTAQTEITTMNTLLAIAKNENASKSDRLSALNKLNEEYGEYLPNLNLENINSKKVTEATNNLTKALIRQAKIKGLQNRISETYAKLYEAESKSLTEQIGIFQSLWVGIKNYGNAGQAALDGVAKASENQKEAVQESRKEIDKLTASLQSLIAEDIKLGGIESSNVNRVVSATTSLDTTGLQTGIQGFGALPTDNLTIDTTQPQNQIQALIDKQNMLLQNSNTVATTVSSAFTNLGNNLANTFTQSGNIFGAFVGTIIQLGTKLVADLASNAVKQIAIQKAVSTGAAVEAATTTAAKTPFGAFALPALIAGAVAAVGSAFSGISGGSGGGATSGVAGNGSSTSNFRGGSSSFTNSSNGGGRVVFEIAGTKLIGVLNNTLERNGNLGGALTIGG